MLEERCQVLMGYVALSTMLRPPAPRTQLLQRAWLLGGAAPPGGLSPFSAVTFWLFLSCQGQVMVRSPWQQGEPRGPQWVLVAPRQQSPGGRREPAQTQGQVQGTVGPHRTPSSQPSPVSPSLNPSPNHPWVGDASHTGTESQDGSGGTGQPQGSLSPSLCFALCSLFFLVQTEALVLGG